LVGVDTGGTFTDLIAVEQQSGTLRRAKVASVPDDPSVAVLDALGKLIAEGVKPSDIALFVHGTTVATNALLEGKGVRAGLIITRGFRAVYEARGWSQPRGTDLVDVFYQRPPMLAPQWLTEEAIERLDYRGEVVTRLDEAELRASARRLKAKGVEAIAVCFLFSFLSTNAARQASSPRRRRIAASRCPRLCCR
jgi:N-methylhydantoinase A